MDEESFRKMLLSSSRTKAELLTLRQNLAAKNNSAFLLLVEEQLDKRFPTWRNPARRTKSKATAAPADPVVTTFLVPDVLPRSSDLVAILPPAALLAADYSKQVLLLFDRIAVDLGSNGVSDADRDALMQQHAFRWLREHRLLTTVGALVAERRGRITKEVPIVGLDLMGDVLGKRTTQDLVRAVSLAHHAEEGLRYSAAILRKMYNLDAVLVSPDESLAHLPSAEQPDEYTRRDMVFRVTLDQFPMPDSTVAWEPILEFKEEHQSQRYMSLLRRWINRMSSKESPEYEVRDEIRELQFEYQEALRLHKIKWHEGTLEVLVKAKPEVAENIVRTFGGLPGLKVKTEHVKLIEAEMSAPGREVAYIVRARQRFQ